MLPSCIVTGKGLRFKGLGLVEGSLFCLAVQCRLSGWPSLQVNCGLSGDSPKPNAIINKIRKGFRAYG